MIRSLRLVLFGGAVCLLASGCFPRMRYSQLGPERVLTVAELQKAENLVMDSDKLWKTRVTEGNAEKALEKLKESLKIAPYNSPALWRAARAASWLAERCRDLKDKKKQLEYANQGIGFGNRAVFVDSESRQGYYYLALSYAMHADAEPATGLPLVSQIIKLLKKADEPVGPGLDYSGPDRVMGLIYLDAPPWPTSVGDVDEALDHLETACEEHPEFPDNQLALAEALIKAKKYGEARRHLAKVLDAKPEEDWAAELPQAQEQARKLMQKLPKKK